MTMTQQQWIAEAMAAGADDARVERDDGPHQLVLVVQKGDRLKHYVCDRDSPPGSVRNAIEAWIEGLTQ